MSHTSNLELGYPRASELLTMLLVNAIPFLRAYSSLTSALREPLQAIGFTSCESSVLRFFG